MYFIVYVYKIEWFQQLPESLQRFQNSFENLDDNQLKNLSNQAISFLIPSKIQRKLFRNRLAFAKKNGSDFYSNIQEIKSNSPPIIPKFEFNVDAEIFKSQNTLIDSQNVVAIKEQQIIELQSKLSAAEATANEQRLLLQICVQINLLLSENLLPANKRDIALTDEILQAQNVISDEIEAHSLIINEWQVDNQSIQRLCKIDLEMSENKNISESRSKRLLKHHLICNQLIYRQNKRLESMSNNVRQLFVQQRAVRV